MEGKLFTDLSLSNDTISFSKDINYNEIYLSGESSILKGVLSKNSFKLKSIIESNEMILKNTNEYTLKVGDINSLINIKTNTLSSQDCLCKRISINTDRYDYSVNITSNESNDIALSINRIYPNNTPIVEFNEMYISEDKFNITVEKVNSKEIEEAGILLFNNKGKIIAVTCINSNKNKASFSINLEELSQFRNSIFSANLILDGHILPIKLDNNIKFKTYVSNNETLSMATIRTDKDNNICIDTTSSIKINPVIKNIGFYDSTLTIKGDLNSNIPYYTNLNYETTLVLKLKNGKSIFYKINISNGYFSVKIDKAELENIKNTSTSAWDIYIDIDKNGTNIISSCVECNCIDSEDIYQQPLFIEDTAATITISNKDNLSIQVKNKLNIIGIRAIGINGKNVQFKFRLDKGPSKSKEVTSPKIQMSSGEIILQLKKSKQKGKNINVTYKVDNMNEFIESLETNGITTIMTINGLKSTQTITDINPMSINKNLKEMIINSKKAKEIKGAIYNKVFNRLPVSKKKVIFESFLGRNVSGNPKYIYDYMVQENMDQNYKFYWVVNDFDEHIEGNHTKLKRKSLKYYYHMATSGYWVFNSRQTGEIVKRPDNTYLQTWHGTPLKKLASDMTDVDMGGNTNVAEYQENFFVHSRRWDYLLAQNDYSEKIFKRAFNFNKEILKGYPANDILYNQDNDENITKLKEKLGLPTDKKVILYAPTWRDNNFYKKGHYKMDLELEIDKMREALSDEYVLVIKAHYLIANNIDDSKYEGFAYNLSKGTDIQELYLVSDIMITDYSSTMFDYANLKRPMIFFAYDLENYRDSLRGFYFDFEKTAPGPIVKTTEDVISSIKHIDIVKENYAELFDNFYNTYCHVDNGNSAKYIVERIFNENRSENVESNKSSEQEETQTIKDNSNEPKEQRGSEDESNKNS